MSVFDLSLLLAAMVALFFGRNSPRSALWIGLGAVNFAASTIYWRLGLPYGAAFAFACDSLVCFSIFVMYRHSWERIIYAIFLLSATVNFVYVLGMIANHEAYSILLEILNYLALMVVGGHRFIGRTENSDRLNTPNRGLRGYMARVGPAFLRNEKF